MPSLSAMPRSPRGALWMGTRAKIAVVVASALLAIGLALLAVQVAADGPPSEVSAGGAGEPGWRVVRAAPGPQVTRPAATWTGGEMLLFGGREISEDRGEVRFSNAIRRYDPAADTWVEDTPAPFAPALNAPSVTWTGRGAIVVGIPCESHSPESAILCSPGGYAAGWYDLEEGQWKPLELPVNAQPDHENLSVPLPPRGFGVAGETIFQLRSADSFWLFDSATATWHELPKPPVSARSVCSVEHGLIVLDYDYERDGEVVEPDPPPMPGELRITPAAAEAFINPRVSVFRPDDRAWSQPWQAPWTARSDFGFEVECTGATGALVRSVSAPTSYLLFDTQAGWRQPDELPERLQFVPTIAVAAGDEFLLWELANPTGLALSTSRAQWRVIPPGPDDLVGVWTGERLLAHDATVQPIDQTRMYTYRPERGSGAGMRSNAQERPLPPGAEGE
jgi:hypothetical protein